MRTTDRTFFHALAAPSQPVQGFAAFTARVKAVLHGLRNRKAMMPLNELDDHRLADLGLTRRDVDIALHDSSLMEDPFKLLPRQVRQGTSRLRVVGNRV